MAVDIPGSKPGDGYVVVARRYRPQAFEDVVGQEQVVRALSNAIRTNRVAHAYLFTGARGVGKTSTARILAKCLNCEKGTSITPCNECDACQAISTGADVDVIEIDGASNRGIEDIRELRQNAGVRPSRSRYKIYIIDEVHMLTKEAFNALLKTLEEPPEHVKFIFCTTEAEKIPITILSRCQRFDFTSIRTESIGTRLEQIVAAEGSEIDADAVTALARRAAGSMRDSQSLLDQLLSFGGKRITAADVHSMLGTASDERVGRLVAAITERRPAAVLSELDGAIGEGVDVGQLLDQILGYFRDMMVLAAGGSTSQLLFSSPPEMERLAGTGRAMGLETILAAMQILAETKARLRYSTQGRILAELALVRACQLEDLDELPKLIGQLRGGAGPIAPSPAGGTASTSTARVAPPTASAPPAKPTPTEAPVAPPSTLKKNVEAPVVAPRPAPAPPADPNDLLQEAANAESREESPVARGSQALTAESAPQLWRQVLANLGDMVAEHARDYARLAISAPNRLVVSFRAHYTFQRAHCERRAAEFERVLAELTGQSVQVQFDLLDEEPGSAPQAPPSRPVSAPQAAAPNPRRGAELAEHPLVKRAGELFGARLIRHEEPGSN